jgi:hypothetical protein
MAANITDHVTADDVSKTSASHNSNDYTKMIYIAGAYGGSESAKEYLEMCCRKLSKDYPSYCFVNGVSEFSHWYGKSDSVLEDLKRCVALLKKCDEVWVMTQSDWDESQGTMVEIFVAMENSIPVKFDKDKNLSPSGL